jgi:hypothetical protein
MLLLVSDSVVVAAPSTRIAALFPEVRLLLAVSCAAAAMLSAGEGEVARGPEVSDEEDESRVLLSGLSHTCGCCRLERTTDSATLPA